MTSVAQQAHQLLAGSGKWRLQPGFTEAELDALARRFDVEFPADYREFLTLGAPQGPDWPDWRGEEMALRLHLGFPARDLLRAVGAGEFWSAAWGAKPASAAAALSIANRSVVDAPRLVPVYGRNFMGPGNPAVWEVSGGVVTLVGRDLADFVRVLCGSPGPEAAPEPLQFWADLASEPPEPPPLGAPPFAPDPPVTPPRVVPPPKDPLAAYAELGINLTGLQRHDDVLAHGAPLWTVRAGAGSLATAQWRLLRAVFDRTGLWPVLFCETTWHRIGPENGLPCTAALLGAPLDGAAWLTAEWQRRDDEAEDAVEVELPRAAGIDTDPGPDDHPDPDPRFDTVALVPTPAPWYVPGLLQWSGAVNYDVDEIGHSAVLRRWHGLWGAEPMALDNEWLTLAVGRPPATAAEGLTAAFEIYLYCLDAVEQGAGSIDALGAMARQRVWELWWD